MSVKDVSELRYQFEENRGFARRFINEGRSGKYSAFIGDSEGWY